MAAEMGLPEEMSKLWLKGASASAAEEDSASRGICQICGIKPVAPATRAAASLAIESRVFCENCRARMPALAKNIKAAGWKSIKAAGKENKAKTAEVVKGLKAAGGESLKAAGQENKAKLAEIVKVEAEPAEESVVCKICVAKGETRTGCPFCLAKAAALGRIKAAGGSIIQAEEESNAKPLATVYMEYLDRVKAAGGCVVETVPKKDGKGALVTVKLPDSYMKGVLSLRPPTPLSPLRQDLREDFQKDPSLREETRAVAAAILFSITRQEKILAQYYKKGYATVDLEVVDFY
ncbi:unnamed protein product [Urochloa humidicola]